MTPKQLDFLAMFIIGAAGPVIFFAFLAFLNAFIQLEKLK